MALEIRPHVQTSFAASNYVNDMSMKGDLEMKS